MDSLELDPDRQLALAYVPARGRAALAALWRLDVALGSVLATGREPMISRIRLAWWRESLEKLDREPAPAEPVLQALAREVLPAGIGGGELAAMEEGWATLVSPDMLSADELETYGRLRGGLLFAYSARLLGGTGAMAESAGRCWALVDLARHSGNDMERKAALDAARGTIMPGRWPPRLRPLGMLAALSERDLFRGPHALERQGSPVRMLRMMRHRLTGR